MAEKLLKFNSHKDYCKALKKEGIRFGPFYEVEAKQDNAIMKHADKIDRPLKIWKNNIYQVSMFEATLFDGIDWPGMWHLSIKRLDRNAFHDWRDMQLIKNCICGPDHEGVELYPMERRLVDSANQYHMFVIKEPKIPFPFGFTERLVDDGEACNTKQRPWRKGERPEDATHMTDEELLDRVKKGGENWHPSVSDEPE